MSICMFVRVLVQLMEGAFQLHGPRLDRCVWGWRLFCFLACLFERVWKRRHLGRLETCEHVFRSDRVCCVLSVHASRPSDTARPVNVWKEIQVKLEKPGIFRPPTLLWQETTS